MAIDNEHMEKLAHLSRLRIDEEKLDGMRGDFENILEYINQIESVDVGDISDFKHRFTNVMRGDDEATDSGAHTDDILNDAPDVQDNYIKVKKVL